LHAALAYDVLVWLVTRGREKSFRERLLSLGRLAPGESVLDVGCGTGTLAIAAKRRVGPTGRVTGIDASPEMLARAGRKAKRAGLDVAFEVAAAQSLPFPDAQFDVVLSTLMLHHLPRPGRIACAREIRRVLKPGGRVLAVDFAAPDRDRHGPLARFHRHGHVAPGDIVQLLRDAKLDILDAGAVGFRNMHFTLGTVACCA
jgi:ubiquinone/menaquinone biosynthesis C-methylase UbiE